MAAPSIDYQALTRPAGPPPDPAVLGAVLLDALADRYLRRHGEAGLVLMEQEGATYLFDLAQSAEVARADRTVTAWAVTPTAVNRRDAGYQRRFPMAPADGGTPPVDRGHLIPHVAGGLTGPTRTGRTGR